MIIKISHSKTFYPGHLQRICAFLCQLWSEFSPWFIFQTLKLLFVSEPGIFKMDIIKPSLDMYNLHNTYLTRTSIWVLPLLCLYFCITVPYLGLQWQRNISLPRGIKGPRARWERTLCTEFHLPDSSRQSASCWNLNPQLGVWPTDISPISSQLTKIDKKSWGIKPVRRWTCERRNYKAAFTALRSAQKCSRRRGKRRPGSLCQHSGVY